MRLVRSWWWVWMALRETVGRLSRIFSFSRDERLSRFLAMGVASRREMYILGVVMILSSAASLFIVLRTLGVDPLYSGIASLSISILLLPLLPRMYRSVVSDVYGRWLAREEPITLLVFTIYSRRLSLERILQMFAEGYIGRVIPRTARFFRYILARSFVSRETVDNVLSRSLDLVPHDGLRRYIFNFVRLRSVGGDVYSYSSQALLDLYQELRRRWIGTWSSMAAYLEGIILIYGLFPTILSSLVFVLGYRNTITVFTVMMIFYPIFTFLVYLLFDRYNVHDPIETRHGFSRISMLMLAGSPATIYLLYRYTGDIFLSSSLVLGMSLLPSFIIQARMLYREVEEEAGLLALSTQMADLMEGGMGVVEAIKRIDLGGIPERLAREVRRMRHLLDKGFEPRDYMEGGKAYRLFRIALSESMASGGGAVELATLRELLKSFLDVSRLKRAAFYIALASSIAVLLLGGYSLSIVFSIITSVEGDLAHIFIPGSIETLYTYAKAFLLMGSIYMGLLLGKLIFGSFRNVLALTPLLLTSAAVYLLI